MRLRIIVGKWDVKAQVPECPLHFDLWKPPPISKFQWRYVIFSSNEYPFRYRRDMDVEHGQPIAASEV